MNTATLASALDPNVLHWLPLEEISVGPQVRKHFDEASLVDLAANIREIGIQQPLICHLRDGKLVLIDGERRFRASPLAGLKRVPVRIIIDPLTAADVLARRLSCNMQRADLDLVERAEGIQQYMLQTHRTAEEVGAILGMSGATVCRVLAVLRLPDELRSKAGTLTAESAYWLDRVTDPARQAELAEQVFAGAITRDQLASEVRAMEAGKSDKTHPAPRAASPLQSESAASPTPGKTETWRMTRSIAPGVSITVSGQKETRSLPDLFGLLDKFMAAGREACARGIPVTRFLAQFRHGGSAPSPEVAP